MPHKSAGSRLAVLTAALLVTASVDPVYPAGAGISGTRSCAARAPGPRRGRPRKFDVPSRAVTLTLPDHVITALQAVDPDISRAIVRVAQGSEVQPAPDVAELATYGNRAVIVVPQNAALKARTGAALMPLADGRALIVLEEKLSAADFELRVGDALADPRLAGFDRALFEKIADILRNSRLAEGVDVEERSLIVIRWKQPKMAPAPRQRQSRRLA